MPTRETAGANIRQLREIAGLTLREVASEASSTESYLSQVESGVRVASRLYLGRIAEVIAKHLKEAA